MLNEILLKNINTTVVKLYKTQKVYETSLKQ